jgi:acetyl coenzyme A synthetase (ADP forming)-like protein
MRNLEKIFNPKTVALIGATDRPGSVGLGICKNLLEGRRKRKVFFVNPYRRKVLGQKTHFLITSIKEPIDLAIIAVPAKVVLKVVKESVEKKVGGIIIISAGFAESGKKGRGLQSKIVRIIKKASIPLIGPNVLGVIRPSLKLNATFAPAMPPAGRIGLISQSGALIDSVIDKSLLENYGFSSIISSGNEADLTLTDFLEWLAQDQKTKAIAIYLEGLKNGRRFLKVAKKVVKTKPLVVIKAGRTRVGGKAALSHTAALAGDPQVYSAAFRQAGIIEVETIEELLDAAKALAWQPRCKNSIAIVTNGGGCGVLAADYCEQLDIKLSKLNSQTIKKLKKPKIMHPAFLTTNPLDIVGDALPERYKVAIEALLAQKDIFGLIVIQTLQIMTDSKKDARIIIEAKKKWPQKPIIACFMGGKLTSPGINLLEKAKIPNYPDPERAVLTMKALMG